MIGLAEKTLAELESLAEEMRAVIAKEVRNEVTAGKTRHIQAGPEP